MSRSVSVYVAALTAFAICLLVPAGVFLGYAVMDGDQDTSTSSFLMFAAIFGLPATVFAWGASRIWIGSRARGSVVQRTAGIFKGRGPYMTAEEERHAFEQGVADDVMEGMRRQQ
jgi:hypothetical protein